MTARFFIQNAGWSILNPSKALEARQAMEEYRKTHPVCEITGSKKNVQIHHIVPVWADPALAADPNNFIALSASSHIHIIYGHDNNFGKKYVANVKEIAKKMRDIKAEMDIITRVEPNINSRKPSFLKAFLMGFWKT
mgnify:CR=1 FL=1|jgi:carboxylesterase type B